MAKKTKKKRMTLEEFCAQPLSNLVKLSRDYSIQMATILSQRELSPKWKRAVLKYNRVRKKPVMGKPVKYDVKKEKAHYEFLVAEAKKSGTYEGLAALHKSEITKKQH